MWWTEDLFKYDIWYYDEFERYAEQDVFCLYKAITKAREFYQDKFNIDILSCLSTASLSYKIFKLENDHSVLNSKEDNFIRQGYYGGYTNYFKFNLKKGYHYDVNSLYPFSMLNDMPHEITGWFSRNDAPDLNEFFGFALAKIKNPTKYELLPLRKDRLYYPANGSIWTGIYFSEELKAAVNYGYEVKLIEGYHFSKYRPFDKYIEMFYNLKLEAERAGDKTLRSIAKLHLNSLYGFFGKSLQQNKVKIGKDPILHSLRTIEVKSNLYLNISQEDIQSKSVNVALAAAVTSYARIHMYKFIVKFWDHLYYVDTDSLFLSIPLSKEYIGSDLGLMKDELNGSCIEYGYFLGIKQYWLKLANGDVKSIFTGIKKNSVTEDEINILIKGGEVEKIMKDKFFHDNFNFDISTKDITRTISLKPHKSIVANNYQAYIQTIRVAAAQPSF